jgi:hypothetical protein
VARQRRSGRNELSVELASGSRRLCYRPGVLSFQGALLLRALRLMKVARGVSALAATCTSAAPRRPRQLHELGTGKCVAMTRLVLSRKLPRLLFLALLASLRYSLAARAAGVSARSRWERARRRAGAGLCRRRRLEDWESRRGRVCRRGALSATRAWAVAPRVPQAGLL